MSWSSVALGELALVMNGKTPSKSEKRTVGHPVLKVRDVDELGGFRGTGDSFVDFSLAEKFRSKWSKAGDTLILNAAHNADYVGSKSFFVRKDAESLLTTGEWLIVRPDQAKLNDRYIHYWLTGNTAKRRIRDLVKGIHLYPKDVARLKIPLPPLPEQQRIAGLLDQADALRRLRRQSLGRLAELGPAIFHEMFGDPISNPKGWDKVRLVECVESSDDIRCGPFGTQLLREEFQEDGIPLWGIKQVNRGFAIPTHEFVTEKKAKDLANYTIIPGDIVMTRKGTIGNCSVYPKDFPVGIMHSDLLRLRIDRNECEPEFISDQLHFSPDIQHQIALISGGAIMQGINVGKLKQIRVLRPPKPLQDEYMRRVHAVRTKRETAIAHEVALDSLFASLQHRAFSGEL